MPAVKALKILGLKGQNSFTLFVSFRVVRMGYTDGQSADSSSPNRYFLDFIQLSHYLPTTQPSSLLTFSHCDKASPIIRSFYQELPCHGHLSLYIKGVMGVLLWTNGPGVGERGSRQRLPWQEDLCCWPEIGNVRRWWSTTDVSVQYAMWRIHYRVKNQRSYARKRTRRQGIDDIFWLQKGTLKPEELSS